MIPPKANAEFVACMEDVLEIYRKAYDPAYPVVCMDESNKQLTKELRQPLPAKPGYPKRYDVLYERNGVATVFMFVEPLRGIRRTEVRATRTAVDGAHEIRRLLDEGYPKAKKVLLVSDQLNTHRVASLYEAFPPAEARRLAERLEILILRRSTVVG